MFPPESRYYNVSDTTHVEPSGRRITYKRLRILPRPQAFQAHVVSADDRPDLVAYRYYQDPEQFWRLADANAVMRPEELTADVGRRLKVPLAEG